MTMLQAFVQVVSVALGLCKLQYSRERVYLVLNIPNNSGNEDNITGKIIIIIGSNGSGKSKLGYHFEAQNPKDVHRICAQRALDLDDNITPSSFNDANNLILYGEPFKIGIESYLGRYRQVNKEYKPCSTVIHDFDAILSLLISIYNDEMSTFYNNCKSKIGSNQPITSVPESILDKVKRIWHSVFSNCSIDIVNGKIIVTNNNDSECKTYGASDMSDGERVGLYLITQCLCINKPIFVIDEPEIHLHRSIIDKLWSEIESEKKETQFIYITHDMGFATRHQADHKIWIKSYNGTYWDFEFLDNSNLPEEIYLSILGNRQNVLFIEGDNGSYDYQLYSLIYPNYYIVPCDTCTEVISRTKAMRKLSEFHHLNCYGLVDRDYRVDTEIENLKNDGIGVLKVAEIENMFLVEPILIYINNYLNFDDSSRVDASKQTIVQKFHSDINFQVRDALISEIKFKLDSYDVKNRDTEGVIKKFEDILTEIPVECIKNNLLSKYKMAQDYNYVLELFNQKGLSNSIAQNFGLTNKEFKATILRQLKSEKHSKIMDIFSLYLPSIISHE